MNVIGVHDMKFPNNQKHIMFKIMKRAEEVNNPRILAWHHCPKSHRKLNVSHFPHIFPKYNPSPTPDIFTQVCFSQQCHCPPGFPPVTVPFLRHMHAKSDKRLDIPVVTGSGIGKSREGENVCLGVVKAGQATACLSCGTLNLSSLAFNISFSKGRL